MRSALKGAGSRRPGARLFAFLLATGSWLLASIPCLAGSKLVINDDKVLLVNGKKFFPIGFTMAPAPDLRRRLTRELKATTLG